MRTFTSDDRQPRQFGAASKDADIGMTRPRSSILGPRSLLAVAALLALPAFAQDFPKLEPGLWQMEREMDRPPAPGAKRPANANRMTMCLDESVQREMFDMAIGSMKGQCSRHDFKRSGNRLTGDFVCDIGGSTMRSKSTMVFDGNRAYRTEIDTTYDPPFMGQTESRMVMDARNVGPCKPGQRPGDVVMPNGRTMNMHDLMNGPHGTRGSIKPPSAPR